MGMFSLSYNLWQKLIGRSKGELRSFHTVQDFEQALEPVDRGVLPVPLEKIVGTVGRYNDFDSEFRPKRKRHSPRLQGIIGAMQAGKTMPPISLYQIKDDFFVLDGHHRLVAAKLMGQEVIQACILELLPSRGTLENHLYLEKIDFRDRTGLAATIELTEPDQYVHLEQQIRNHQAFLTRGKSREISFRRAAADWYVTIYKPLVKLIEKSGLVRKFPGRTIDDLYLYISVHQWGDDRERQYGIGIDKLIPKDMEQFRETMAECKEQQYPEMKRTITVFVLLNVEGKHEQRIMDRLFALDEVLELHSVHGSIDIVVKAMLQRDLLTSDAEVISRFTHGMIRTIRGVKSTQTLIPGVSRVKE